MVILWVIKLATSWLDMPFILPSAAAIIISSTMNGLSSSKSDIVRVESMTSDSYGFIVSIVTSSVGATSYPMISASLSTISTSVEGTSVLAPVSSIIPATSAVVISYSPVSTTPFSSGNFITDSSLITGAGSSILATISYSAAGFIKPGTLPIGASSAATSSAATSSVGIAASVSVGYTSDTICSSVAAGISSVAICSPTSGYATITSSMTGGTASSVVATASSLSWFFLF